MATLSTPTTATQCSEILAYLKSGNGLTQKESIELIGSYRLASRIFDLTKKGHNISVVREMVKNRHGRTTYINRYFLSEFQPDALPVVAKVSKNKERLNAALFYIQEQINQIDWNIGTGKIIDNALKIAAGIK